MSQHEMTGPIGNGDVSEQPSRNLSRLADLARQAYGQKRTKDCLDLTRAILLIDPDNTEAQLMRSAIRSEMHQDLENTRALLRSADLKDKSEKNSEADFPLGLKVPQSDPEGDSSSALSPSADVPFVSDATPPEIEDPIRVPVPNRFFRVPLRIAKRQWLKRASVIVFVGLIAAGLPRFRSKSNSVEVPSTVRASSTVIQPPDVAPVGSLGPVQPEETSAFAAPVPDQNVNAAQPPKSSVSAPARPSAKLPDNPVALAPNGTLAVNSPTSTDVYMNDLYVGSTPLSLQISPGIHVLEYRHATLRKRLTHVIASNETTRAMVTFDVTVQINARPWAEVFLDGVDKRALGQTPLSGVRVPIGGVLVFENPGFQAKKYRVTGNETGIQIVFP